MRKKPLIFFGICIVVALTAACALVSLEEDGLGVYPTQLSPLDITTLQQRNQEYQEFNDNRLCSTLNEFGFTGFSRVLFPNDVNPCLTREVVRVELTQNDTLVSYAKQVLLDNQIYTGVFDTTALEVTESIPLFGCTICEGPDINNVIIEWKVSFAPQNIDTLALEGTDISVLIDAEGANRILGNWYPDFFNPERPNVDFIQARTSLIGFNVEFEEDDVQFQFEVADEDLSVEEEVSLRTIMREGNLEFRRGWIVRIAHPQREGAGWEAFVDVIDGQLLSMEAF